MLTKNRLLHTVIALLLVMGALPTLPALAQGGDLTFGEPIMGELAQGGTDTYTFAVDEADLDGADFLDVWVSAVDGVFDPMLELYSPDGALLTLNNDIAPGQPDAALSGVRFVAAGEYRLVVRAYGNQGGGAYRLLAAFDDVGLTIPMQITLNQPINDSIDAPDEIDLWRFDGSAGQVISIAMNHTPGSALDPVLELLGPDGSVLAESDDDGGNLNSLISGFELPEDGQYTITASSWGATTGDYVLSISLGAMGLPQPAPTATAPVVVQPTPTLPPSQPGMPPVGAEGSLEIGDTVTGDLAVGMMDVWTFQGAAGDFVQIAVDDAGAGTLDPVVELFAPDGGQLVVDDDGGPGLNSLISAQELPAEGEYVIRVRSFADTSGGEYTLSLTATEPPQVNTGSIEPGQTVEAELALGSEDAWTFTASADEVYSIGLYAQAGTELDTVLRVEDASGVEVAYSDDGGISYNSAVVGWMPPADGEYTIFVGSYGGGSSGSYELMVLLGEAFPLPESWMQGELTPGAAASSTFTGDQYQYETHIWTLVVEEAPFFVTLDIQADVSLEVLDSMGQYVRSGGSEYFTQFEAPGTYFVVLYNYTATDYTITAEIAEAPQINTGSIEPGQTLEAELSPFAEDQWTLVAEAGQPYSIAVYATGGAFDTILYILDENGNEVAYNDDGSIGLNSMLRGWTPGADGEYTIVVGSFGGGGSGPYSLTVETGELFVMPEGWMQGEIVLDEAVSGSLTLDENIHVWEFTVEAGQYVTLDYTGDVYIEATATDSDAYIYFNYGAPTRINQGGTYRLIIEGYNTTDYTVLLAESEPPQINTGNIEPGQTVEATLDPGAEDEWTLVASADEVYTIAVYGEFDTVMAVYDEQGYEVNYNDDGGPGLNSMIRGWRPPADGAYVIRVRSFGGSSGGQYSVSVALGDTFLVPDAWMQGDLMLGEPITGAFAEGALTHVWTLTLDEDAYLLAETEGSYYLELLTENGDYGPYVEIGVPTEVPAGTYLVVLNAYNEGDYALTLSQAEAPEANVGNIERGQTVEAVLDAGAEDEWTFTTEAGEQYTIAVYATEGSFDSVLRIVDASGYEVDYNDDGGIGYNSQLVGWTPPGGGEYTILVSALGSGGGAYTLSLIPGADFYVPDSMMQGALAVGDAVSGEFENENDIHLWQLEITADEQYLILADAPEEDAPDLYSVNVELLDAQGNYINYLRSNAPTQVEAGTYYLQVSTYSGDPYAFVLQETEPPQANIGTIEVGETLSVEMDTGAHDEWTFTAEAGQAYTIAVYSSGYAIDPVIEVYNADGGQIGYDDDGGFGLNSMLRGWQAPSDGDFTVLVRSFSGTGEGFYAITVQEGNALLFPDGLYQGELAFEEMQSAALVEPESLTHIWSFTVEEPIGLRFDFETDGFAPSFDLFDAEGSYGDYIEPGLVTELTLPGTYYIMMRSQVGMDYTIALTPAEAPEPTIGEIAYGDEIVAELQPGVEDEWTFTAAAGDVVTITLTATDNVFDTYLTLLDEDRFAVITDDDSGEGFNSMIEAFVIPEDGDYTIAAGSFNGRSGGEYTLTLTLGE